jgi:hypothetical protein
MLGACAPQAASSPISVDLSYMFSFGLLADSLNRGHDILPVSYSVQVSGLASG